MVCPGSPLFQVRVLRFCSCRSRLAAVQGPLFCRCHSLCRVEVGTRYPDCCSLGLRWWTAPDLRSDRSRAPDVRRWTGGPAADPPCCDSTRGCPPRNCKTQTVCDVTWDNCARGLLIVQVTNRITSHSMKRRWIKIGKWEKKMCVGGKVSRWVGERESNISTFKFMLNQFLSLKKKILLWYRNILFLHKQKHARERNI